MVRRNRPSRSARDVAAVCASRARERRYAGIAPPGLADELQQVLRTSGAQPGWHARVLRWGAWRRLMDLQERWLLPGLSAHLLARKRFVEEQVRAAIAQGARQLVVLGAGYDPVAARALREHPGLHAIEVDHAPTQARKARAYAAWDGRCPVLVPLDFSQLDRAQLDRAQLDRAQLDRARPDLGQALEDCAAFEPGAPSVFVAEGLVMYLDEDRVLALLRAFARLVAPGSRLILSTCDADARGRPRLGKRPGFARAVARLAGEPLRWGIRVPDLAAFAGRAGLVVQQQPTREELERALLPRRDHPLLILGAEPFAVLERPAPGGVRSAR